MVAFKNNPQSNASAEFIFNLTPDYRAEGPSLDMDQIAGPADAPSLQGVAGKNWATLPPPFPIPPPDVTGYRGNGTLYDTSDYWLHSAFRLAETSDPTANSSAMIGFAHVEDHYVRNFGPLHRSVLTCCRGTTSPGPTARMVAFT